jgi:hypothetical protein
MAKIGLKALVISAGVALVLLTLFSELMPVQVNGFRDVTIGDTVSIDCMVVSCGHSKTGLIMTAVDRNGDEARIYLQSSVLAEPVLSGSAVRVAVTPSEEDPAFMFASSVKVLSYPEKT